MSRNLTESSYSAIDTAEVPLRLQAFLLRFIYNEVDNRAADRDRVMTNLWGEFDAALTE